MKIARTLTSLLLVLSMVDARKNWNDKINHWIDHVTDKVIDYVDTHNETFSFIEDIVSSLPESKEEAAANGKIAFEYFDRIADQFHNGLLPIKNSTCIAHHCTTKISACVADATCRENMMCAGKCGTDNTTCTFYCSQSYKTPVVDAMFDCLYVEHECLSLPPPDALNNATCRDPKTTVATVDENMINGDWYVVRGFNPLYDCFACQQLTFNIKDGKIDYEALFSLMAVNNTEIWLTTDMTGEDQSTPGHLHLTGVDNGLPDKQDWNVMMLTEDTLVVYYCGNVLDSWHFEGLLIMSKTKTLEPMREPQVASILAALEISADDVCMLDPATGCNDQPELFFTQ